MIKPPMFSSEIEKGEEVEASTLRMGKYFQIYNYSNKLKDKMTIHNLTGKEDIWWEDINKVNIRKTFKKHFKRK